ncbi:hypothetical protein HU200_040843 [Digitaria exilis]|uniref:Gnk2-homologous domain-containing protein n=1 Tax=Digitaria exilis TaxID=1010633 RepID=A0A835B6N8_9POAL|nr:hypothetical protein HU200_040843 [Digitaria exilis]CAB3452401.1 unnamed protein product [Digitaria exilis]
MAAAPSTKKPSLVITVVTIMLLLLACCSYGDGTIRVSCNATWYSDDDPFSVSKGCMMQELLTDTPRASLHDIYRSCTYHGATAYGHATCSPALDSHLCENCLSYMVQQMATVCVHSVGGMGVYEDKCNVRFQNYAFTD